jgi:hypothetical protein
MRVYGHSYRDTMQLPMRAFWAISGTVPRLLAGERRDHLEVATISTHNQDGAQELYTRLDKAAPEPVTLTVHARIEASSMKDEDGLDSLRSLA